MKKALLAGILMMAGFTAFAEPEIKGTASELAHYIAEVPKTVAVTGEAEVRVPAKRAILSLRVITENRSLQDAMRQNLELRGKIADYLKGLGIPADRIQAAKFSSTPKFGMFSEKAKSYRLENVMRISVQDEKEFQVVAGAIDKWAEAQYDGVEFQYEDKEQQKQSAIAKACENAGERKKIYEEKLGLKLTAAKFDEVQVGQRTVVLANGLPKDGVYPSIQLASGYYGPPGSDESVSSFGEMIYTARVSVEYAVQTK